MILVSAAVLCVALWVLCIRWNCRVTLTGRRVAMRGERAALKQRREALVDEVEWQRRVARERTALLRALAEVDAVDARIEVLDDELLREGGWTP